MNEQLIGDLFAEATRRMTGSSSREFSEKFAELIIRKCAQVADTERPSSLGCGYITKTTGMRIKEHFGVD
jgi:hypothetical protein